MRLRASSLIMSCLLVGLSSALPSKDTNRGCSYGGDPNHTRCSSAATKVGDKDGMPAWEGPNKCNISLRGINEVGQKSILEYLNKARNKVAGGKEEGQPPAANMKKLVWNEDLATTAQRWADQCQHGHDTGHRNTKDGTNTGQNGFFADFSMQINEDYGDYGDYYDRLEQDTDRASDALVFWKNLNIRELSDKTYDEFMEGIGQWTDAWYGEVKKFTSNPGEGYVYEESTGHYTQDVWAETGEVGCGWTFIKKSENSSWKYYEAMMYCNFLPAGNMIGAPIYEVRKGDDLNCPDGFNKDDEYQYLCSK